MKHEEHHIKILVAEDDPTSRRILEVFLNKLGYEVTAVCNGKEALQVLQSEDAPTLAILDWMMPEVSGTEVCQAIRRDRRDLYTYILLLTARTQKANIIEGLEAGADDYIQKPFDLDELRVRLRTGCRLLQLHEQLIASREAYHQQASHDSLTGLWNHNEILSLAERELARSRREGTSVGLILADLDHFKKINDRFGHLAGDAVLCEVTQRLSAAVRPYDFIGRFGGEEFLLVITGCDAIDVCNHAERLRACIANEPVVTSAGPIAVSLSLGAVSTDAFSEETAESLLEMADQALYRSKAKGRNQVSIAPELETISCL